MFFGEVPGTRYPARGLYQSVLCTLLLQCCCNVTAQNFDPRTVPVWRYDSAATAIAAALLHDAPVGVDCCCFVASI